MTSSRVPVRKFALFLIVTFGLLSPAILLGQSRQADNRVQGTTVSSDGAVDGILMTEADGRYQVFVTRATASPRIDGQLDDSVWRRIDPLRNFTQSKPNEGEPISERTEIRITYDDESLYVAAMMYDRRPEGIVTSVLRRDQKMDNDDSLAITLDTYHDHRNGYYFQTNALGAKYDAQIIGEGTTSRRGPGATFNDDWDAVWRAAGTITEEGWAVEIAIPFWSLRFDVNNMAAWGINFRRTIRRNGEEAFWAPVPRQYNATRLSLSGLLLGLQSKARPRNLQVKPYVLGDAATVPFARAADGYQTDYSGDAGLDVKWAVTPNMTLDLTANTDFSQVEADDVQINLTRFPLFFPEKREFFLENAGLFQFGAQGLGSRTGPRVIGFHSRRIGINEGRRVPLMGGGRLTGKIGRWSVGGLTLQTANTLFLDSTNQSVLRVRRDLGSRSNVGFLFTNQTAGVDDYNRQIAVDGRWAISPQASVDAWWMKTETPGVEDGESAEWAGQVSFDWGTPSFQVMGNLLEIGEAFNPGMGFVSRTGMRNFFSMAHWTPYPAAGWIRNLAPHVSFSYLTDRDGRLLTRKWHFDVDMYLKRGDKLSIAHDQIFEQLDFPFEIVPGVVIPPGAYDNREINLELNSDTSRVAYAILNYTVGPFFDGNRAQLRLGGGFRMGARFSTMLSWAHNDIELPAGDFVTDIMQARLSYDFSRRLSMSALIQYDNLTDQVLSNIRVNFIHTPGADLFLVYNERRISVDADFIDRAVILKATHLLRF